MIYAHIMLSDCKFQPKIQHGKSVTEHSSGRQNSHKTGLQFLYITSSRSYLIIYNTCFNNSRTGINIPILLTPVCHAETIRPQPVVFPIFLTRQ